MKAEPGQCPICGEFNLEYGCFEMDNDSMGYYPWECNDCHTKGKEWYSLEYIEQTTSTYIPENEGDCCHGA
jgi:hypothetical protein